MARNLKSPYPDDAVFGVHKGFKTGVFTEYRDFLAQTADYPGGKELWAVFTDPQHAREYVSTGRCPVRPLDQRSTTQVNLVPDGSARSLPTPDASPETDVLPPSLPTRQRPTASAPMMASASQPAPAATRRQQPTKPDPDSGDDTEPEEEFKPPSATLPAAWAKTPRNAPPRRPFKSGSITRALVRDLSGTGERPKTPPIESAAPAASQPAALSTTTLTAVPRPSRGTQHGPPTTSGPGRKTVPAPPVPVPAPAPSVPTATATATATAIPVPTPIPNPALSPELPRQPRPHGTYEQCHHCNGTGWNITPAQPTNAIPSSQTPALQTPSRPRPTPTTNLRIFQAVSDSDRTAGPSTNKIRTPSGGRLRVASVGGGIGPERTPKRDPKRVVSDSMTGRRARVVSEGAKDKGKGKARAVEPMDVDVASSEAGPSAYDYM